MKLDSSIDDYYAELSKEFVSSAGIKGGRGVFHGISNFYNSSLLDKYQAHSEAKNPAQRAVTSVHPCISGWDAILDSPDGHSVRAQIEGALSARKSFEFRALGLSIDEWTGLASDAYEIMLNTSKSLGYSKVYPEWVEYPSINEVLLLRRNHGLIFYVYMDKSKLKGRIRSKLPLYFFVGYDMPNFKTDFYVDNLCNIVPGVENYANFIYDAEAGILGISALLEIFSIFSESF